MSPEGRIARGAVVLLSAQPITWVASLAIAVFLPHFLGDRALGQYALASTIALLAAIMTSFGVIRYVTREVAASDAAAARLVPAAIVLLTGLGMIAAVVLSIVLPIAGLLASAAHLIPIALVGMVVSKPAHLLSGVLHGQERFDRLATFGAVGGVGTAVLGLGALALGGDVGAYIAAFAGVSAATGLILWRMSGFELGRAALDTSLWGQLLRGGMPFLGWSIALRLYAEIDKILLAFLSTEATIGWYAASYRIVSIPLCIPTLLVMPLLPVLARTASDMPVFQRTLRRSVLGALLFTVPTSALLLALAPAVPGVLHWPSEFQHAIPLMTILALQGPLVAVDMVLGTALVALGRERRWALVAVVAAVFNPVVNLGLIPAFERSTQNGAIGAAIVTVLTEVVMLCGALRLLPASMLGRDTVVTSVKIAVAGAPTALAAFALLPASLSLAVLGGCIAFIAATAALGIYRSDDVRAIGGVANELVSQHLPWLASRLPAPTRYTR